MAFQFKRDRGNNIALKLIGDIDLEITPDIKAQLNSQIEDASSLNIDARDVSYLDSSGVSIMVIAMQTCKQRQLGFTIDAISDEAVKVLQLAKLDKILPIKEITGPANMVDVDVFSPTGDADSALADEVGGDMNLSDEDLIAALSADMDKAPIVEPAPEAAAAPEPAPEPAPVPEAAPAPVPEPAPAPAPEAAPEAAPNDGGSGGDGGKFTPGTF